MRNYAMRIVIVLFIGIFLGGFAASVCAQAILDFNIGPPTPGSISYAGGPAPVVGTGIGVDSVIGLSTPTNSGILYAINNGVLSFTSGPFTGSNANNWFFSGGGSILLTGGIPGIGIADGTTLLTGVLSDATIHRQAGPTKVALLSFQDTKDEDLLDWFGLSPGPSIGSLNLSFSALGGPPSSLSSDRILSGDLVNNPVPEPTSLFLIGSALAGFGVFQWRRKSKKV